MSFAHNCNKENCDHSEVTNGIEYSLYTKIDLANLQCLNEEVDGSCKSIFRPWDDRLSKEHFVKSDVDEELLINIPFNGCVKLKSIILIGGEDGSHPKKMRLFNNKPYMSFDNTTSVADQEIDLVHDPNGIVAYPIKIVKFSSVHHLTIHIPTNYGDDSTVIYYIGLQGDWMQVKRQEIVITTYEAKPNPADHKNILNNAISRDIQ